MYSRAVLSLVALLMYLAGPALPSAARMPVLDSGRVSPAATSAGDIGHTATVLGNGGVLFEGGYDCNRAGCPQPTSAELYDAATGRWSPTGSMMAARSWATATLLRNGMVLVAGGIGCRAYCGDAELYDPATGRWALTGSMYGDRAFHTATLLSDGKVLVAGGIGCRADACADAEVYDPTDGVWRPTGSMREGRFFHTATLLRDGQVLVTGGEGCLPSHICASAELYDPPAGAWRLAGRMGVPREEQTATLLPDGKVLVAGGYGCPPSNVCSSAELYDPTSHVWSFTGNMHQARAGHTATLLSNGMVLVAGGYGCDHRRCRHLTSTELYDPATGRWQPAPHLRVPREYQTASLLPGGVILFAGGATGCSRKGGCKPAWSTEIYAASTLATMPAAVGRTAGSAPSCRLTPMPGLLATPHSTGIRAVLTMSQLPHTNGWMPAGGIVKFVWGRSVSGPYILRFVGRDLWLGRHAPRQRLHSGSLDFPYPGCWRLTLRHGHVVGHVTMLVLGD